MNDSTTRAQERSDAQSLDCPNCGDQIQALSRRSPTNATAQPCGCSVSNVAVREFTQDRQRRTEGGF